MYSTHDSVAPHDLPFPALWQRPGGWGEVDSNGDVTIFSRDDEEPSREALAAECAAAILRAGEDVSRIAADIASVISAIEQAQDTAGELLTRYSAINPQSEAVLYLQAILAALEKAALRLQTSPHVGGIALWKAVLAR